MTDEPQFISDAITEALGERILDALEDLWTHVDRSLLRPETILTLEFLEDLHTQQPKENPDP